MKIKILALILCAAMLMTFLAACNDKENVPVEEDQTTENADGETEGNSDAEEPELKEATIKLGGNLLKSAAVDEEKAETAIKAALTRDVAKKEILGFDPVSSGSSEITVAEGHKTLRTENNDGKVYAYVNAEIMVYSKDGEEYTDSGVAAPFVLIFDIDDNGDYVFSDYKMPEDGANWVKSLKEIFPEDLVAEATGIDYNTDFYQDQIKAYLQ